jgi:acetylserotonin O-methyltransferase
MTRILALCSCTTVCLLLFASRLSADEGGQPSQPVKALILPGESFLVDGRPAFVLLPPREKRQKPQPWIMYAPTLPAYPDSHEKWMTGYIYYSNSVMWRLWANLEDAVREGTHRWKQTYGWEGPIFSHFFKTEEAKREFLMGMHGFGLISSPHVVTAFDLSRFTRLVDLGGATGHLAIAACQRWSNLRAVVFDLPDAVPLAQEIIGASPVAERIEVAAGDFFSDALPKADLYALGRILHDWTEEKILKLLGRIYESLPPNGAVLIAEKLLDDDRTGPRWAQMQDLNMLSCTEGKERTLGEYEVLLKQVGFGEIVGCRTPSPLDAVLATKTTT